MRKRILGGLAAVAAGALVAGCGSSKPSSTSATSGSQGATATTVNTPGGAATGAPIKVGLICSCSGTYGSNLGPAADVYKAWANTTNASGGLNGHPIQITLEDDAGSPGTSATDAQTLISDKVQAIVDLTVVDQTWAPAVEKANIPVVGQTLSGVPFYTNPDFYPPGQTNDSITYANVVTAKAAGATNLGSLYCAESVACQEGVPLIKAAAAKLNIPVSYTAEVAATSPNYTAQCVAAQQQKISALFIGDASTVIARIGESCEQQGYHPIYVTEGEGFKGTLLTSGGVKDNLWSEYNNIPYFVNTPAVQAMNAATDKYYPGLRNNVQQWSEEAVSSWASGLLLRDAVKASGLAAGQAPTSADIVRGLEALKGDTLEGMSPPLTFAPGKPHPVDCWFTARVQNGKASLVNNGKLSCGTGA